MGTINLLCHSSGQKVFSLYERHALHSTIDIISLLWSGAGPRTEDEGFRRLESEGVGQGKTSLGGLTL